MYSILHSFHINAPVSEVYESLSTVNGLQNWWTRDVRGNTDVDGTLEFRFGTHGFIKVRIANYKPGKEVHWICTDAHPEWINTTISFTLVESEGKTKVRFKHEGWKEATDFYASCNFSWGRYLESLRNFCETGRGNPFTVSN